MTTNLLFTAAFLVLAFGLNQLAELSAARRRQAVRSKVVPAGRRRD